MIRVKSLLPLLALLLTACSATGGYQSPEYRVPEGTRVELTRVLHFPGRSARIYIQFGGIVRWQDVDQWAPHCSFGLNRKRDGKPLARDIASTVFTVVGSRVWVDVSWNFEQDRPTDQAGNRETVVADLLNRGFGHRDDTPSLYIYKTRLTLYSEQEPQVDDLTCAYRGSRTDRNLTMDEIRNTLGNIARIH